MIASFYWEKVTNKAFTVSVLAALGVFLPVRFSLVPMNGVTGLVVDVLSIIGVGVVAGLMVFGFLGLRPAKVAGVLAAVVAAPFAFGAVHDYATLSASLVAYSVSTIVCWALSQASGATFDFDTVKERVSDYQADDDLDPVR